MTLDVFLFDLYSTSTSPTFSIAFIDGPSPQHRGTDYEATSPRLESALADMEDTSTTRVIGTMNQSATTPEPAIKDFRYSIAKASQTLDKFDTKIHALPQELQDNILAFVGLSEMSISRTSDTYYESSCTQGTIIIGEYYKPPAFLQLNRKLREKFAIKYYTSTVFECRLDGPAGLHRSSELASFIPGRQHKILSWLRSLTHKHRELIKTVQVTVVLGFGRTFATCLKDRRAYWESICEAADEFRGQYVKSRRGRVDRTRMVLAIVYGVAGVVFNLDGKEQAIDFAQVCARKSAIHTDLHR